jgi:hypothetical protein
MKGLDNQLYVTLLVIANLVAVLQLVTSVKWPRIARLSFFMLFAWASWTNWKTCLQNPLVYLEYADLTWSSWYKNFINGWFANNIILAIGFVATCQAMIAIAMLLKGWIFSAGCIAAIAFLLAILPLGIGAGFPSTAIMAFACYILLRKQPANFLWEKNNVTAAQVSINKKLP